MYGYLNKFLPEKAIVGNSNDKDSVVGRELLIYLNSHDIIPEAPRSQAILIKVKLSLR